MTEHEEQPSDESLSAQPPEEAVDVAPDIAAVSASAETETTAEPVEVAAETDAAADAEAVNEGEVNEGEVNEGVASEEPAVPVNPAFRWYVVHTYSGYENRAKKSLEERIRQHGQEALFGEILIPMENVVELSKGGQKKTSKRKFFPGYMLVQMELNDETWHFVNGTPKITGFVGNAIRPPSIPEEEVRRVTQQIDEGTLKPKPRVQFEEGENVRVIEGAFANFNGVVEVVNRDKSKVRVRVSIFGRPTPVELDFIQVEKA